MHVECVDVGARQQPTYLRPNCYYQGFFFRLAIPAEREEAFVQAMRGSIEEQLLDKVVDATGVVQQNGRWAEIVIDSTDQLRVATGWRPAQEPTRLPTVPLPTPPPG